MVLIGYSGFELYQSKMLENERLNLAAQFVLKEVMTQSPNTGQADQNKAETFVMPELDYQEGDTVGILYIPRLNREIPIVEGTDEEKLAQGVGHYIGTGFPGEGRQILLSGHRDTVFRQFGELEHGDEFHVQMAYGTFVYEIMDHEIVDAYDTTVIDFDLTEEVLTVSTCYPFSYIGNAPDRYVVYAYPKWS